MDQRAAQAAMGERRRRDKFFLCHLGSRAQYFCICPLIVLEEEEDILFVHVNPFRAPEKHRDNVSGWAPEHQAVEAPLLSNLERLP